MNLKDHVHIKGIVPPGRCDGLMEYFVDLKVAQINLAAPEEDIKLRKTVVEFLPKDHWLSCMMFDMCVAVNNFQWHYDLVEPEPVQLTEYEQGGHYEWHADVDPFHVNEEGRHRKITSVLMLSDPSDYEEGEFMFRGNSLGKLDKGDIIVFPAFLEHKVAPVKAGLRRTVVCWATGPSFR